ncbi:MAG TPA: sigma-70 family RNA polymerase sigma factor [Verrucomicrobiae bacterium]|nr:sigma-70 family RNA polymerase sigma factor [Verrucomicrobiae bacterium]
MEQIEFLTGEATRLAALGAAARQRGDRSTEETCFREALDLALQVADLAGKAGLSATRLATLRMAAGFALDCGDTNEARRLMTDAMSVDHSPARVDEWEQVKDPAAWSEAWLVAAVRLDPPDPAALDELVCRHWKPLFGRCQILTVHHEKAHDLAQEVWNRLLRNRHALKTGGNFRAYLMTIATNLWRDSHRSARRAGPLAENRLESLDTSLSHDDSEGPTLLEGIPDLRTLAPDDQALLSLDIDQALKMLAPQLREVLVARYIDGESCAEIGRRYGRTEQSISGWIRQAAREMRAHLQGADVAVEV